MISIIVYGRNDNYGYNLHKRAAISLNCLAEVLRDPDDEIIFVDYNSPDDLPTFPEAIADTLTPHARSVLRILRVRPNIHARYSGSTRLLALEAVARNIGVRRSNPANRWILSTNTDIILIPRRARDLSSAVADLPPGFYHTARFEIPESLWESFDRADPQRTIEDVRSLGRSARLNEVVYGADTILYDGPGDFQLVERASLFAIDGFDERMIRAWHVDSNLAKRLSLQCGAVRSLIEEVYCYHCDHTRQATPAHTRDNIGNDSGYFVDEVTRSDLPHQREAWGCAADAVEEIRLPQHGISAYRAMLGSVLVPLQSDFTEAFYRSDTYNRYDYDPQHVLPFLADLLNSAPRDTRLAWCGVRGDMFQLFCEAWRALGFRRLIAINKSAARPLLAAPTEQVEVLELKSWLAEADLFAFEFGLLRHGSGNADAGQKRGPAGDELEAIAIVESAFLAAVADERRRRAAVPDAPPRRFIGINCIHNRLEFVFSAHIGAALTPFGSHLRHGFVAERAAGPDSETTRRILIGDALGRARPISAGELAFAEQVFAPLLNEEPLTSEQQHRAACHGSLGEAFLGTQREPRNRAAIPETAVRAMAELERLRPSTELATRLGVAVASRDASARPLSRFADCEDWDDPSWSAFNDEYVTDPEANLPYRRNSARWAQVHLLYGLDRAGLDQGTIRAIVVATMPDAAIAALSRSAGRVEIFSLEPEAPSEGSRARAYWCNEASYNPESLAVLPRGTRIDALDRAAYDAVIFPHGAMFRDGLAAAVAWMRAAEPLLRTNGVLAFKADIAAGPRPHPRYFDIRAAAEDGLAAQIAKYTGFAVAGGFDPYLSRATIDRVWPEDGPIAQDAYFLSRDGERILIPSYWFLGKQETSPAPQWERLRQWLQERWVGEQLPGLMTGTAGTRREDGRIAALPERRGHVFFGPYIPVEDGGYRAKLHLRKQDFAAKETAAKAFAGATIEAVIDETVVAAKQIGGADLKLGTVSLDFDVHARIGDALPLLEIRLDSQGGLDITVESLELEVRELYGQDAWPELPAASSRPLVNPDDRDMMNGRPHTEVVGEADRVPAAAILNPEFDATEPHAETPPAHAAEPPQNRGSDEAVMRWPRELVASREGKSSTRPLSRTMADEDWDDPSWARYAEPPFLAGGKPRNPGLWERTHILYGLDQCGKLTEQARILIAATMPDQVIALLSEHAGRVEVIGLRAGSGPRGAEGRLFWSNGALYARDRLIVHDRGADELEEAAYDAVVFPHGAICCAGISGVAGLMEKAEQLLAPGGVLAFKADILAGGEPDPDHLDAALVSENSLVSRIENDTGFALDGNFDARLPWHAGGLPNEADLVRDHPGRPAVPSLWFLRKRGAAPEGGWARIEGWLVQRLLGEQLHSLRLGPAGRRDESGRIVTNEGAKGFVFFGPYLVLPGGRYEAIVEIELRETGRRGRLSLDVAAGGRRLQRRDVSFADGNSITVRLPFELSAPSLESIERLEIRAWSSGSQAAFSGCRLHRLDQ